jgi:MATE family multidrug resistance protein
LAANSILIEIAVFIAMFLDAIANTTETLVGEAYIRKDKNKLREIIYKTLVQCIVITIIFTIIYALTYSYIIDIFTSIESVKIEAHQYIIFSILLPLFAALSFWIDGVFVGMLKTVAMRNAMLLSMISYMILVALLSHFANYGLWIAVLCFYIARVVFLAYPLSIYMKKEIY